LDVCILQKKLHGFVLLSANKPNLSPEQQKESREEHPDCLEHPAALGENVKFCLPCALLHSHFFTPRPSSICGGALASCNFGKQ